MPAGYQLDPAVSLLQQRLIGRVVIHWARLDAAFEALIWRLLGVDLEQGRLITARLELRPKLEMVRALAPKRLPTTTLLREVLHMLELAAVRQAERNAIVHGLWGTLTPRLVPAVQFLQDRADMPQLVTETFPEGRMQQIITDIEDCTRRIQAVIDALPAASEPPVLKPAKPKRQRKPKSAPAAAPAAAAPSASDASIARDISATKAA